MPGNGAPTVALGMSKDLIKSQEAGPPQEGSSLLAQVS